MNRQFATLAVCGLLVSGLSACNFGGKDAKTESAVTPTADAPAQTPASGDAAATTPVGADASTAATPTANLPAPEAPATPEAPAKK